MTQNAPDSSFLIPDGIQDPKFLASLLESVLKSVPDAMIVCDEKATILAFSNTAEALFGYKKEQVIGENVSLLMTTSDQSHHDDYIRNYLKTGERQIIGIGRIVEAKRSDGVSFPVELKIGEAELSGQRLFTGFLRDISERRANDHRMNSLQAELASFSRLSAVGTMASAMAHELNQPLTAIANYLEAADDLLVEPDENSLGVVRDALSAATQQSIRAGQIVRRLRDYVSRGELELRPARLDAIIQDAASLSKVGIKGPLARTILRLDETVQYVLADRLQLRQVFVNLIRNAMEALADTETPQIWIETERQGDLVEIKITDNGPGLSPDLEKSPFEAFQSTKDHGMGLGLSICQTILEAHGSTITFSNASTGGACFTFSIQIAPELEV